MFVISCIPQPFPPSLLLFLALHIFPSYTPCSLLTTLATVQRRAYLYLGSLCHDVTMDTVTCYHSTSGSFTHSTHTHARSAHTHTRSTHIALYCLWHSVFFLVWFVQMLYYLCICVMYMYFENCIEKSEEIFSGKNS